MTGHREVHERSKRGCTLTTLTQTSGGRDWWYSLSLSKDNDKHSLSYGPVHLSFGLATCVFDRYKFKWTGGNLLSK